MKRALIFGRGVGVYEEMRDAAFLLVPEKFDYTIGVGPSVAHYPGKVDAWVWFHVELFPELAGVRAKKGYSPAGSYWSIRCTGAGMRPRASSWPVNFIKDPKGGASGLIATYLALYEFECERVVLAGCPMTVEGNQVDTGRPWREATKHRWAWERDRAKLIGKVASMSGWTRELLGYPTTNWLLNQTSIGLSYAATGGE